MPPLPADWNALCALVFVLGLKHGFDADHLAMVDGLTRYNTAAGRGFARWCGALFAAGHGAVVLVVAGAVGLASAQWAPPAWLHTTGGWVSIGLLLALGLLNLRAVLAAAPGDAVRPVGLKGAVFGSVLNGVLNGRLSKLGHARRPGSVALVGALFALSLDTMAQAALFAVAGAQFGGAAQALLLGAWFMLGMLVVDGLDGLWVARLLHHTSAQAALASRVLGLVLAGVSLAVAALGAARMVSPEAAAWSEGKDLTFGAAVMAAVAAAYLLVQWRLQWRVRRAAARLAAPVAAGLRAAVPSSTASNRAARA